MSSDKSFNTPSVLWAQRPNCVFLTIALEDCQNPVIKVENDKIFFHGAGGTDKKEYEVSIDLYDNILPDSSLHVVRERNIEFCLKKEKEGPYWPRLTKSSGKKHWLKVDFNKWKDEDESDEEGGGGPGLGGMGGGGDNDFEEMMRQMGGLGGGAGGMGAMGGMGGLGGLGAMGAGAGDRPNLDDFGGNETDSDDDNNDLPDLE